MLRSSKGLNGHNHFGGYVERKGVHYLTFQGMVDDKAIHIHGYGREPNRELLIKK